MAWKIVSGIHQEALNSDWRRALRIEPACLGAITGRERGAV